MKSLTFKIEAEDEIFRSLLTSFCKATGWTQNDGITKKQHANNELLKYFYDKIEDYEKEQEAFKGRNKAVTQINTLKTATSLIPDSEAE
jgi:hypothetical protein